MQVLWYNTNAHLYQSGSYQEFKRMLSGKPNEIEILDQFRDASARTLNKIVSELNKCRR